MIMFKSNRTTFLRVTLNKYGAQFFCCSPDGKYVAISPATVEDARIRIMDINGKTRRYISYDGIPYIWIPEKRSNFYYLAEMLRKWRNN